MNNYSLSDWSEKKNLLMSLLTGSDADRQHWHLIHDIIGAKIHKSGQIARHDVTPLFVRGFLITCIGRKCMRLCLTVSQSPV